MKDVVELIPQAWDVGGEPQRFCRGSDVGLLMSELDNQFAVARAVGTRGMQWAILEEQKALTDAAIRAACSPAPGPDCVEN